MSKKWSFKDLKDKGIFVNADGVGKVLAPSVKKKVVTEGEVQKVLDKLKKKYDKDRL